MSWRIFRDIYQERKERRREREDKLRRYQYPLFISCIELERRLGRLISSINTDWLKTAHIENIRISKGFAENPNEDGYFLLSTSYYFAKYLCWLAIILRESRYMDNPSSKSAEEFDELVTKISRVLRWREMWDDCDSLISQNADDQPSRKDAANLYNQFQHSIGESLITPQGETVRCMSFREFLKHYTSEENFRYWFVVVEDYFVGLVNMTEATLMENILKSNDVRPLRLLALEYWLAKLAIFLSTKFGPPVDMNPESILSPVPEDIRHAIRRVEPTLFDTTFFSFKRKN